MDGLPWSHIGAGSGWTLAVGLGLFIVRQISTGNWITRREHDEWRAESRAKDATIAAQQEQLRHMGELGRLVDKIMRALRADAQSPVDTDGST